MSSPVPKILQVSDKAMADVTLEMAMITADEGAKFQPGQLGMAGVCYGHWASYTTAFMHANRVPVDKATYRLQKAPELWPFGNGKGWHPKNPRRDLVRAAALIMLEIEAIDAMMGEVKSFDDEQKMDEKATAPASTATN